VQFTALRLVGFKSFLEPTELEISPGLTGVVGPNGCGKSNLVEALRWVMGENSAKRMRGGEMDDVIFGGSTTRPARNLAEVSLVMDNSARTAPAAFNDGEAVEVTRIIERGQGSDYKVNRKPVRAKDVALLFQDNGTGPHSASLVSQGRIGALIAAKPTERRQLLEEAAGITGLHTRRHEAELRLKSAETNLQRLDDVMGTMQAQLQLLKKQARQASRYRNINTEVRRQEAALLWLRWQALQSELADAQTAFATADARVSELMLEVASYENARQQAAEQLPPLRLQEAEAAAGLQRLVIAREQIDTELARVATATDAAQNRRTQAESDKQREQSLAEDASRAIDGIDAERIEIKAAQDNAEPQREQLIAAAQAAVTAREQAESKVAELQQRLAQAEAEVRSFERRELDLGNRRSRAEQRAQQLATERAKVEAEQTSDLFVDAARREAQVAEAALGEAAATIEAAEQRRTLADTTVDLARERTQKAEQAVGALQTEQKTIERILAASTSDYPPVLERVTAQKGYEQALAVALGEDLGISLDSNAPSFWQQLPAYENAPALPGGAQPLSRFIEAPAELSRRLALVGVVADAAAAALLADELQPGQSLVTPEGAAWRWDGVVIKPGAPTVSAVQLQQRNRLQELQGELAVALQVLEEERARLTAALTEATEAVSAVRSARDTHNQVMARLTQTRRQVAEAEAALSAYASKLATIKDGESHIASDLTVLQEEEAALASAKAELPALESVRSDLAQYRVELAQAQAQAADAQAAQRQYEREHEQRSARLVHLDADYARWRERAQGALSRISELDERIVQAAAELVQLAQLPAQLNDNRAKLVEQIEGAEARRSQAADALAVAESALREQERTLKAAESAMSESREQRATAQAAVGNVQLAQQNLTERITEKCECAPEGLMALAEVEEGQPLPEPEAIEARLEKLVREREALGPVNLRAEQEADEQQAQIDSMDKEKADLIEAIAKLRGGISSLNREARERLLAAYGQVQEHFKRLFTRLFGGGQAEIRLTEAEDPLDAGLEIIASPPGKKLQNLSLLSGGEQALTSLALLFAVFLVNPSPICVLDEVDAPLDEANIDRFCNLLDEMVKEGKTRFLVITHQRLTMSRMDRLYGVTMMEKGVSTLVSVDLQQVEDLKAAA
jgi:chromosome segregation protein